MIRIKYLNIILLCFTLNTICTAAENNWMAGIKDTKLLSQLSIPGTHDSGARYEPLSGTAKCQNLTIAEQLNAGVRFLDIRCRHIDNTFTIHHGSVYQNINFDDVLNACTSFLDDNPSESIIMSVKEEYDPENNTRTFLQTLNSYISQTSSYWYLNNTVPILGSARGKIVLFRRFGSASIGLNASNWADDTTFSISGETNMRVQDNYNCDSASEKWTDVSTMLTEAKGGNASTLYVNFSSGYTSGLFGIPSITSISNSVNPNLNTFFSSSEPGRYGIILMDFATAQLAQLIYSKNTWSSCQTMAYWRFEGCPASEVIQHSAANGIYSADIIDHSLNNNALSVASTGSTYGYKALPYTANSIVQNNWHNNTISVQNTGDKPFMFCNTNHLRNWSPKEFTLEFTAKFQSGGYRTYIGRDSQGSVTGQAALSALYLQALPDNSLAFKFCDTAGNWHTVTSAANVISCYNADTDPYGQNVPWYSVAAVSDGETMAIYLKNHDVNTFYLPIARADISSDNPSLSTGTGSGSFWQAGTFTVGRGLYEGGYADAGLGIIDEVKISEGALEIRDFLFSRTVYDPVVTQQDMETYVNAELQWQPVSSYSNTDILNYITEQYIFISEGDNSALKYAGIKGTSQPYTFPLPNLPYGTKVNWQIISARVGLESSLTVNSSTVNDVNAKSIFGPVFTFTSMTEPVEPEALVAWYKFEDNCTDSTNGYNGTANGTIAYTDGVAGKALQLNGSDRYIEIPRSIKKSYTIQFWIKTTDSAEDGQWWQGKGIIDGEMPNSVDDFGTALCGDKFAAGVGDPDTTIYSTTNINDGQWHMCTATRDNISGELAIYIDGVLEANATGPSGIKNAPSSLSIGRINTDSNYLAAEIDEVRLFNYTLNELQVADEYYNTTGKYVCLASKKPSSEFDLNNDCIVNLVDMAEFMANWLKSGTYSGE